MVQSDSSFAKKHLKKHGWVDGKGLGKSENGMKDAIKVKVKNNLGGLGHNPGTEFTFHWWDHIFNKAANSIEVKDDENEGVKIEKSKDPKKVLPVLISNKKPMRNSFNGAPLLYGTFVKSGTYVIGSEDKNEEEDSSSSSSEGEDEDLSTADTLERTYRKTGFTGHKAARHGHRLSGKLLRIQEQEQKSAVSGNLKQSKVPETAEEENNTSSDENSKIEKRKKKESQNIEEENNALSDENSKIIKRKKKKSKNIETKSEEQTVIKKKKKRKIENVEENNDLKNETVESKTEIKKKKRKIEKISDASLELIDKSDITHFKKNKKNNKKKTE